MRFGSILLILALSGCGGATPSADSANSEAEIRVASIDLGQNPQGMFLSTQNMFAVSTGGSINAAALKDSGGNQVKPPVVFQYKLNNGYTAIRYQQSDGALTDGVVNVTTGKVVDCSDYDLTYAQLRGTSLYAYSKVKKTTLYKIDLDDMSRTSVNRDDSSDDANEEKDTDHGQSKTIICHQPNTNPHTLSVSASSVKAHLKKGDTLGACAGDTTVGANFFVTYDAANTDIHNFDYNNYSFLLDVNGNTITRVPGALEDFFSSTNSFVHHTEVGDACQGTLCKREILALASGQLGTFTWFQDLAATNTEIASLQMATWTPQGTNADKGIYNEGTTVSQMALGSLHPVSTVSTYRLEDTDRYVVFQEGFYHIYVNGGGALQADFFWMTMPDFQGATPILSGSYVYWNDSSNVYRKLLSTEVNTPQVGGYYTETSAVETVKTGSGITGFSVVAGTVVENANDVVEFE